MLYEVITKEMLDNHFKIVEPYLKGSEKKSPTPKKTPTKKKTTSSQKSTKNVTKKAVPKRRTSKKIAAPRKPQRKPIEVDLMPLEIKIIRRYLNFQNKRVRNNFV